MMHATAVDEKVHLEMKQRQSSEEIKPMSLSIVWLKASVS